jgi:integrase/recombinase XerD
VQRSNEVEDVNFDRKFNAATEGCQRYIKDHLLTKITPENRQIIIDYIMAFQTEAGPSQQYRIDTIYKLKQLAEYHNPKSFRDMRRQDAVDFLDHFRKPEAKDPLHKWIGTYEVTRIYLLRFFKWLHRPNDDISPKKRPTPAVMQQIPKIKRREVSIYKATDLWTEEDDALFYKYCPSSRDRCWHAVSRDTGCRPHEMLKLKIKDVVVQQLDSGHQVARITVNGKTGVRQVRINNSYPRLKEWLSSGNHPYPANQNAPLFCGQGTKNTGRRLSRHSINIIYTSYKKVHFPRLLKDPAVPDDDKLKIADLLKKPWNPYIRRHTAATEISKALKDSVLIDQYMGWSHAGNTRQKYQHYYNDDSFDAMLTMMDGLKPIAPGKGKILLKLRICPNCSESNTPESRFCAKCKFVLTFDAYNESIADAERVREEQQKLKKEMEELKKTQDQMVKTATKMQQLEDWLDQYRDENLFSNIETMIWEYLDPPEDGTVSKQERLKRQSEFPELVKAAKKLQKLRLPKRS